MTRTAQEIGDELYALAPADFTAARDGQVSAARNAANRALATELGRLKRPSVAAALVNLVALRRPEMITALLDLGREIREAQGNVTPLQLRDLSAQRRRQLDAAIALATSLAAERGDPPPSRAALTEVESTFAAAMADDDAAQMVRAGRVLKVLSYSGFGHDAGPVRLSTTPGTASDPHVTAQAQRHPEQARQAEAALQAEEALAAAQAQHRRTAEDRVAHALAATAEATTAEADAENRARQLNDQIAELRSRLDATLREARIARQNRIAAEHDLASAQRRLDRLG